MNKRLFKIFGVGIKATSIPEIAENINSAVINKELLTVTYVTANSLNLSFKHSLHDMFNKFSIVFPDGTGSHLALKYYFGKAYNSHKMTGTDLLPEILKLGNDKGYKLFLYGENVKTIELAKLRIHKEYPKLNAIFQEGYNATIKEVVNNINSFSPDIVVLLTGSPLQERFVIENIDNLNCKILVCLGAALKVYSGEKIRGPKIIWNLGLEWVVRLITEPKLWKRYILGNPLFVYRVIKSKNKLN